MRFQFVRNHLFILENNDGRAREVTGQIELSDDNEAFVFGEQVIRQVMQGSGPAICGLRHGALRGRAHRRSYPLGELSEASLTVAHRRCHTVSNCHGMDAVPGLCTQGGDREPSRSSFSARPHRIDEAGS